MKFRKHGLVVALIALIALAVAGCSKEPLAATVNGKPITIAEVDEQLNQVLKVSGQHSQIFNGSQGEQLKNLYRAQLLDRLINIKLMMQEAEKRGITVTDKDIDAKLKQLMKQLNIKDDKQLDEVLKQNGLTKEQMRDQLRQGLIIDKLGDQITKNVKVTDKEVEDYYNTHKSEFATKDQIHAAHILLQTESEANKVLQQLHNGADFAALAKQYNPDSTKNTGGDLSWVDKDQLDPAFAEAAWNMQPGQISSQPVKTKFGYHIIKLIGKKPGVQKTFEEAKAEVKDKLLKQKKDEVWQKWFDGIKKKADIKIYLTIPKTKAPPSPGTTQGGTAPNSNK